LKPSYPKVKFRFFFALICGIVTCYELWDD
jgi:hypothetical protein